MMTAVSFDTLKLADRLQAGGFTPEQARTAASALTEAMSGADLATKADLRSETGRIESAIEPPPPSLTFANRHHGVEGRSPAPDILILQEVWMP